MTAVECTHCRVLMTSWSAPNSPVRYWQCPFCSRTHSSLYAEVFQRGAGARRVEAATAPAQPPAGAAPQPSADEVAWAQLKLRAARWFARLEEEGATATAGRPGPARARPRAV